MMAPVKRSRVLPALALTAALALSGCSGVGSDPGVSVDGQQFSVAELQEATAQLNQAAAEPTGPQQVVADLALLPLLEEVFAGSPAVLSESQVREVLTASGVADPGPATLAAATSRQYQLRLGDPAIMQDPEMADVVQRAQSVTQEDLAAVDVEVNPRYGAWDVDNGGVVPQVPEWIRSETAD